MVQNIVENSHISSIPFPAVTICPYVKAVKGIFDVQAKLAQFSEGSSNLSAIEYNLPIYIHQDKT